MSGPLIALCGAIYLAVAIDQAWQSNIAMAITYFAYALANVGLYMVAVKG